MTRNTRTTIWRHVSDAAKALNDAVTTPRGEAPARAIRNAALRREHY